MRELVWKPPTCLFAVTSYINSLSLCFPYFLNEDANTIYLIRLLSESNETTHVEYLVFALRTEMLNKSVTSLTIQEGLYFKKITTINSSLG